MMAIYVSYFIQSGATVTALQTKLAQLTSTLKQAIAGVTHTKSREMSSSSDEASEGDDDIFVLVQKLGEAAARSSAPVSEPVPVGLYLLISPLVFIPSISRLWRYI